jgi:hypothetical protein
LISLRQLQYIIQKGIHIFFLGYGCVKFCFLSFYPSLDRAFATLPTTHAPTLAVPIAFTTHAAHATTLAISVAFAATFAISVAFAATLAISVAFATSLSGAAFACVSF